jgi:acetyl esterase/lipase
LILVQVLEFAMKICVLAVCVVIGWSGASAQQAAWQPSEPNVQVPIWPRTPPDAQPFTGPETIKTDAKDLVAGKPWVYINNVSRPTMTVYPPKGKNTGVAVLVFPGGGYQILAIDLEGTEVCDWLTSKGITCVLLKYRVPGENRYPKSGPYPDSPIALEDAQRTLGLVRSHAEQWHIDPHKIGVLGFSAGGHLVAAISTHFEKRLYSAVDAADEVSCRPDFAVAIYPGHLALDFRRLDLNPNVPVTKNTPPTFILQAEDDNVDGVQQSLVYYIALMKAGVPAEMHLYAQGGHAFGLRRTKLPVTGWPDLVETWLGTIRMIRK